MPIEIRMPALSPTMTEGALAKWLKQEGDEVKSGDALAEIETDKATMEMEAVEEGVLGKILVPDGTQGVKVNDVIGLILEEGEDKAALDKAAKPAPESKPAEPPKAEEPPKPAAAPAAVQAEAAVTGAAAPRGDGQGRLFASPLARRLAGESGIDLSALRGSGPHGRIVKADVEKARSQGVGRAAPPAEQARPSAPTPEFGPAYEEVPNTGMRKTIARRLAEAKATVPHFYLTIDCDIEALMRARADLNAPAGDAYKLSVNDFVVRASALALRKVPAANASWTEAAIRLYKVVDISVAVATPGGLITPIVKNADQKGLAVISNEMKDLAKRARDGKLKPEEFQGGTFTVSNLGMFGIREFAAILNPPQGCILAVGAGEQRPVVKNGALAVATMMSCTLSVDHRVVDGAVGAEFLAAFKKLIEDPLTMLL